MILVFDTETTGLPPKKVDPMVKPDLWPHIVQIAWMIVDNGEPVIAHDYIVKPVGYEIPLDSIKVHGISNEQAQEVGSPIEEVLRAFYSDAMQVDEIVAHNAEFDLGMVYSETKRLALTQPSLMILVMRLMKMKHSCTMKSTTNICKIPGKFGYKFPKLEELHKFLFKEGFEGAHDAFVDLSATARCYYELKDRCIL